MKSKINLALSPPGTMFTDHFDFLLDRGYLSRDRQALEGMFARGLTPAAVVLLGPADAFTEEMLQNVYPSIEFVSI